MAEENPAAQRQTAVTAHSHSKQLLLFVVARRNCTHDLAEQTVTRIQHKMNTYLKHTKTNKMC